MHNAYIPLHLTQVVTGPLLMISSRAVSILHLVYHWACMLPCGHMMDG